MRTTRLTQVVAFVLALLTLAPLASVTAEEAAIGSGIAPADMDLAVDPGVDFYRYANGGWFDRTEIPSTAPDTGAVSNLASTTHYGLLFTVIDRAEREDAQPGSDEWKAIRLYQQGIDLATRNAQGVAPIRPILDQIAAIGDLGDLHRFLEGSVFLSVPGFFSVGSGPDMRDSTETVAYLAGPPLGLPRDYFLVEDAATTAAREAYVAARTELLTLAGDEPAAAQAAARAVLAFETRLAQPLLSTSDLSASYNPTAIDALATAYPLLDWPGYLAALGLNDVPQLVVQEPRSLATLDATLRETPLAVVKDFLRLQLLWSAHGHLSEAFGTAHFRFEAAVSGVTAQGTIMDQTLNQVDTYLGDALGRIYVDAFFSAAAKARAEALVEEIVAAFRLRLERNPWLSAETKARALAKLAAIRIKVGYPDRWRDYAAVAIGDSYFASTLNAFGATYRDDLAKVGQPVDKDAWFTTPQTVNAYYNPLNNEIVLPAAILQAPFFDPTADPAANFGAIGFIVGHEITHAFDPNGSQFDADGNLADWWTDADRARFGWLTHRVAAQYGGIEVGDGQKVDGRLTVGENVADLGGIQAAHDALQAHLARNGRPLPPVPFTEAANTPHLTQEQQFFVAAATIWRAEIRDEALATQLKTDPHAPSAVRATQPLRNSDAFHAAFDVDPGDPMYLPPAERIVVW